jgi:hypothetical protein
MLIKSTFGRGASALAELELNGELNTVSSKKASRTALHRLRTAVRLENLDMLILMVRYALIDGTTSRHSTPADVRTNELVQSL